MYSYTDQNNGARCGRQDNALYQIENCHPVANRGEKMGAIGAVEQIALAVDSAEQVRELDMHGQYLKHQRAYTRASYLEVSLHCHLQAIADSSRSFPRSSLRRQKPVTMGQDSKSLSIKHFFAGSRAATHRGVRLSAYR